MEKYLFEVLASSETCCSRCGDVNATLNKFGVCEQCNADIDEEYLEIYNIQNMEF